MRRRITACGLLAVAVALSGCTSGPATLDAGDVDWIVDSPAAARSALSLEAPADPPVVTELPVVIPDAVAEAVAAASGDVPESVAPDAEPLEGDAPDEVAPEGQAPETAGPDVEAPESGAPEADTTDGPPPGSAPVVVPDVLDAPPADDAVLVDGDALELTTLDEQDRAAGTAVIDGAVFQTIGLTWPETATAAPEVQVRVRSAEDGSWSEWLSLEPDGASPDPGTGDAAQQTRAGSGSVYVGESDAVQVATVGPAGDALPVDDVQLALIGSQAPEATASDDAATAQNVGLVVPAVTSRPAVVSRAQWGAAAPTCTLDVASRLNGAVVHHTADGNGYATQAAAMQQIRNDQSYHMKTRGWCDLGYNFVVDKWGTIYEGRAGSMDAPVVGVHATAFNTGFLGVALLGNYEQTGLPAAAANSAGLIIGWRLGYYGVDPTSSKQFTVSVATTKLAKGQVVTLPVVMGHKDVSATACPGRYIYPSAGQAGTNLMPTIRNVAAANLGAAVGNSTLVKASGSSTVYLLDGSSRRKVSDPGLVVDLEARLGSVQTVSPQVLDDYAVAPDMQRAVRNPATNEILWVGQGRLHWFPTCDAVEKWIGKACGSAYINVDSKVLSRFPKGPSVVTPAGVGIVATSHVADIGWSSTWSLDGQRIGTTGQARRLEALAVNYVGASGSGVECRAHVSGKGWLGWSTPGSTCGTTGQGRRVEALQFRMSGPEASTKRVWYRAHVANIGWMGWASNGATAGTTGYGQQVEAVEIRVLPAASGAPGSTAMPSAAKSISVRAHAASLGWLAPVGDGGLAGTTGQSRRLEALTIAGPTTRPWQGAIECSAHVANVGWTGFVGEGAVCGTTGRALQLEGVSLRLTGDLSKRMDIWYRVHSMNFGWSGWAQNGARAGTQGYGYRAEAVEVRLVAKGAAAPGSTDNILRVRVR